MPPVKVRLLRRIWRRQIKKQPFQFFTSATAPYGFFWILGNLPALLFTVPAATSKSNFPTKCALAWFARPVAFSPQYQGFCQQ
jgi:hypothetical protein